MPDMISTLSQRLRRSARYPTKLGGEPAPDLEGVAVFPGGGGTPDMQAILQQAQKMQEQLIAAQQKLADAEVEGSAGGGLVKATVSGSGELKALAIDPKVVDPDDVETLSDLVVAAVRDAGANAQRLAEETMGPLAGGLGGGFGLPGM
ncbi:hypothetical protein GCM10023148_06770 [Actinokineospora soli]